MELERFDMLRLIVQRTKFNSIPELRDRRIHIKSRLLTWMLVSSAWSVKYIRWENIRLILTPSKEKEAKELPTTLLSFQGSSEERCLSTQSYYFMASNSFILSASSGFMISWKEGRSFKTRPSYDTSLGKRAFVRSPIWKRIWKKWTVR